MGSWAPRFAIALCALTAPVLVLLVPAAAGTPPCDVYASAASGSDISGAGTEANPYATAGRLLTDLSSGETGCLRGYPKGSAPTAAGLYEENVNIATAGITLRSYPGEVAQIKGRLIVMPNATPATPGAPGVTVSQLVLDGRNTAGGTSPLIQARSVQLVDNDITTRNTTGCVKWVEPALVGAYLPAVIRHNRIHDCVGSGMVLDGTTAATVSDNIIFDMTAAGIRLASNVDSSNIGGNVIDGGGIGVLFGGGTDSNYVHHNVVSNPSGWTVSADATPGNYNLFTNNCVYKGPAPGSDGLNPAYTAQGWLPGKVYVQLNVTADPAYVNRPQENFNVTSTECNNATGGIAAATANGDRPTRLESVNLRPNVLVFVTDDQRADSIPTSTAATQTMPETFKHFRTGDAANGIKGGTQFDEAFATTPLCCPSRASIFSGKYAHNHGIHENDGSPFNADETMQKVVHSLPKPYYTGLVGSFLINWIQTHGAPPDFDSYRATTGPIYTFTSTRNVLSNDPADCPPNTSPPCETVPTDYSTTYFREEAKEFIAQRESTASAEAQPWLLHVAVAAPHADGGGATGQDSATYESQHASYDLPFTEGPGHFEADLADKPAWAQFQRDQPGTTPTVAENSFMFPTTSVSPAEDGLRRDQLRTLRSVDTLVSQVFQQLRTSGEEEDTIAIFTSDNGYMYREHGPNPNAPTTWRESEVPCVHGPTPANCGMITKDKPYTASVKVPYLMRWPGNPSVATNRLSHDLVGNIDIAPTVLGALGMDKQPWMDGYSLLDASRTREYILTEGWQSAVNPQWTAIRTRLWEYIKTVDGSDPDDPNRDGYDWYADSTATPSVEEKVFREYYVLNPTNPVDDEEQNLYGPDGVGQTGDDVGTPPQQSTLDALLNQYAGCAGNDCP